MSIPERQMNQGGPRTAQGKAASRGNAVTHGMSAKALLPEILTRNLIEEHFHQLAAEWNPATATERFVMREMARHLAALTRIEEMENAVLRRGANWSLEALGQGETAMESLDAALAGAGTSDGIDRITRYRRPHERAFAKNLALLQELKLAALAQDNSPDRGGVLPGKASDRRAFKSDNDCVAYLVARLSSGMVGCSRCHEQEGLWIATRGIWKCGECGHAMSLRSGTVMAGSHLSLLTWFRAIEIVLRNRNVATADLMSATGIKRPGTARQVALRLREAFELSNVSELIAGLDHIFISSHKS